MGSFVVNHIPGDTVWVLGELAGAIHLVSPSSHKRHLMMINIYRNYNIIVGEIKLFLF